jgi:predicted metalloprotease with PDZ domain
MENRRIFVVPGALFSTRSVVVSLARPFKAGINLALTVGVASATHEIVFRNFHSVAMRRTSKLQPMIPALKGRARLITTLTRRNTRGSILLRQGSQAFKTALIACLWLTVAMVSTPAAQTISARIAVVSTAPPRVRIEIQLPTPASELSFINTYAGILGLGERIEAVEGIGTDGNFVPLDKLAPGEFRLSRALSKFRYEVNLAPPSRAAQMSHVSWLNSDNGLLMLADLLPQGLGYAAEISIDVPSGWTVAANVKGSGSQFSTTDPDSAVFLVSRALHEKQQQTASGGLSVITSGEWPLSDGDLIKTATRILQHYTQITGFNLKNHAVLMLVPYAGETGPDSWTAETRGNVVVLLLGKNGSRKRTLSRLGIVLSHELLHLWVPNSLRLAGNYDWFFEGFTLYQALRTDLRLGLISFDDYLETMARVYDSYLGSGEASRFSLLEASERRWTTQSSLVYDQGMLVAFIYDLALRKSTDCKASLDDIYAELFRLPATGQASANETIIRTLTGRAGFGSFAHDYLETTSMINLDRTLSAYGIVLEATSAGAAKLSAAQQLSKSQRKLLGCLGYRK